MNLMGTGEKRAREETVNVEVKSALSGKTYQGAFRWRAKTLLDEGRIAAAMSELALGAEIVDELSRQQLKAIATLTVVVTDHPDWWEEVRDNADITVVHAVYTRYIEWWAAPFRAERERLEQDRKQSLQASSSEPNG